VIAVTLCWYREPLAALDRCVRSLAGVTDLLIALDGRWRGFADDAPAESPADESDTIQKAAAGIGLDVVIVAPSRKPITQAPAPWESQVAKRAQACLIATELGADYAFVIDGDEWIEASPEFRGHVQEDLVYSVLYINAQNGHVRDGGRAIRRIYSTAHGLTVDRAHNGYRTLDDPSRWLHGNGRHVDLVEPVDLSHFITLFHDSSGRDEERSQARDIYRSKRRREQLEVWV